MPEPGIVAKNQLPSQVLQWISPTAIDHLNPDSQEYMLCSNLQLSSFYEIPRKSWGKIKWLHIYWDPNIEYIICTHVNRWIVEAVKEAYIRHDLWHESQLMRWGWFPLFGLSKSSPAWGHTRFCFWCSTGVFQCSYLRDMTSIKDDMTTLGCAHTAAIPVLPPPIPKFSSHLWSLLWRLPSSFLVSLQRSKDQSSWSTQPFSTARPKILMPHGAWWRHQMGTFSASLAFCAGNSPVTGEFPAQRPGMRSWMFPSICPWTNSWANK